MASQVIKKDGTTEPFEVSKINSAIRKAASSTELSEERIEQIVSEVSATVVSATQEVETITSYKIKDILLSELDKTAPEVSRAWREYKKQ